MQTELIMADLLSAYGAATACAVTAHEVAAKRPVTVYAEKPEARVPAATVAAISGTSRPMARP